MEVLDIALGYFQRGGPVMVPLVAVSFFMWIMICERFVYYTGMEKGDLSELIAAVRGERKVPEGRGMGRHIALYMAENRTGEGELDRRLLDQCGMRIRPGISRNLGVICILAAVSPLLGLLGTVTGMITTFDVIAMFGTGNARALAGGISEALITTQSGLMVSIPGMLMSVLLVRKAKRLEDRLDETLMTLKRHIR